MFKMNYEEYFDAFEDIDELKKAAKLWVKADRDWETYYLLKAR